MTAMTALDRSRPPRPEAVHGFRFPDFERTRLDNGLDVLVARWPHFPLLNLQVIVPAGGQYDEPGEVGLASFHAGLLDEGTEERSALEIAAAIEDLGGYLGSGSDWNVASVGVNLLTRHRGPGLDLLAEILRRPSFPEEELERLRRRRLTEILRRRSQPSVLAQLGFAHKVFAGTVFAEPLIGTEESIARIGRDGCLDFYRRHVRPEGATLIAVGDSEPAALRGHLEEAFGDWRGEGTAERPRHEPRPLTGLELFVVDRPGSTQTQLQLGHLGIRRNHPDHPKAAVMNALLGGSFTGRINLSLRERHGITYGAYSQFVYRQGPGAFLVRAAVNTDALGTAVREVLAEMRRMREELVTEEELRECQDFLVGVFPTTIQTVGDLARRLEDLVVHDLGDGYFDHYPAVLREVTREDVQEAARRYLDPERLAVVAVGEADLLVPQLEELGDVKVHRPGRAV